MTIMREDTGDIAKTKQIYTKNDRKTARKKNQETPHTLYVKNTDMTPLIAAINSGEAGRNLNLPRLRLSLYPQARLPGHLFQNKK